uniref:AP-1 complex subunit sigma-3 n=1 Tax=Agelaius phoeniceus TaxID=39638 RepID=UPI0023EBF80F|nr:AP-1 complex subunit sigma-3 [Agelaius phoeniceus]
MVSERGRAERGRAGQEQPPVPCRSRRAPRRSRCQGAERGRAERGCPRHRHAESHSQAGSNKIHFILLFSRQGKLRLQKWYTTLPDKEKKKIIREIIQIILSRNQKTSSFVDWKDLKLVYKRYASLYFCCAIEDQDNELLTLEVVHRYVELLDRYFGNVCELDIIFNFEKAYFILDEFIIGGEVQETSKKTAVKAIEDSDMLQETVEEYMNKPAF